ncbi:MAG TPA: hypothetical protein VL282_15590 [Tepidisphaeraceae bacterium]|jgi:hypothetical protein|nr:hypothetical protein [Tepidisphaeraceae bacterium]
MATWNHAKLGEFSYDYPAWEGKIALPAFRHFTYEIIPPRGQFELAFMMNDQEQLPSRSLVSVAERIMDKAPMLAREMIAALWDDINGEGPNSGIWWHGDFAFVASKIDQNPLCEAVGPLTEANDLYRLLGLQRISVLHDADAFDRPVAEFSFAAAFEDEYGVGIITDGNGILGIGYSADVTPFDMVSISGRLGRSRAI